VTDEPVIYRLPDSVCPICARPLDSAGPDPHEPDKRAPQADDPTVCLHCGEVLAFTATLSLRILTNKEWKELTLSQRRHLTAIREFVRTRPDYEPR
jgi:hypothetical protein